jgi:hypothetical protein
MFAIGKEQEKFSPVPISMSNTSKMLLYISLLISDVLNKGTEGLLPPLVYFFSSEGRLF